jgi:hypothetical protein
MTRPEFQYRPTPAGGWTATHARCQTTSDPYPLHSLAQEWTAAHECPNEES